MNNFNVYEHLIKYTIKVREQLIEKKYLPNILYRTFLKIRKNEKKYENKTRG